MATQSLTPKQATVAGKVVKEEMRKGRRKGRKEERKRHTEHEDPEQKLSTV